MKTKIFLLLVLVFSFSCEDFLDEDLISGLPYAQYETESGVEQGLNGAYSYLRSTYGSQNAQRFTECGTDIYTEGNDGTSGTKPFHWYSNALAPDYDYIHDFWSDLYLGINTCNVVLYYIPQATEEDFFTNENGRAIRMGEARFLRALYYFLLVQTYGDVPLLLEASFEPRTNIKRSPVSVVYQSIINDLRYAEEVLPPASATDYGRATKGAAQHLIAKVYLTRASAVTEDRGQKSTDLDSAIFYSEKVINNDDYSLIPNISDLWDPDNQGNEEVIFAVQFGTDILVNPSGNSSHHLFICDYSKNNTAKGIPRSLEYGFSFSRVFTTNYILDVYDNLIDSRFYKTFRMHYMCTASDPRIPRWSEAGAPSEELVNTPKYSVGDTALYLVLREVTEEEKEKAPYVLYGLSDFEQRTFPSLQKHHDPFRESAQDNRGTREVVLMRLGETYLIAGESHARKGNISKALEYFNEIRERAAYKEGETKPKEYVTVHGGDTNNINTSTVDDMMIDASDIQGDNLVDFVLDERARELVGEYWRWFDLVRTEKFYDRVTKYNGNETTLSNVRPEHKLRPIPSVHIERLDDPGPVSEEQNPGYY